MASLIESFEQQFAVLTAEITSKTCQLGNQTGVEKKMLISQVERQMEEAHELLEQMDLEIRGMAPAPRQKYQLRLKSYISELSLLEKELRSRTNVGDEKSLRDELFDSESYSRDEQKQCLLDNTERLERSSRQLEGGYRLAIEAEEMGAHILSDLHSQRETIARAKERVRGTNYEIGKSSRILSGMIRGALQQKVVIGVVGCFVAVSIIVGIYFIVMKS